MNKSLFLLLVLLLTGCASFQVSTLNHDPIYSIEGSDAEITVINNEFELRNLLRTDFNFRYNFAQYAISQPRSFDWNNRVLGNRYSFYNPYYSRSQMWNDWVWGYNWNSPHRWSPFGYDRWGYNNYGWNNYGWNNYGWNNWGWNGYYGNSWGWRQQMNNYAWQHRNRPNTAYINGRRGSNNIQSRIVVNNTNRTRVNVREDKVDLLVNKIRKRVNNNIRVYNNPNNPNLNNNNKPRVYVRPNNNSNNNTPSRIYTRPSSNTNTSTTKPSSNVSRSTSTSRGGNSNKKN